MTCGSQISHSIPHSCAVSLFVAVFGGGGVESPSPLPQSIAVYDKRPRSGVRVAVPRSAPPPPPPLSPSLSLSLSLCDAWLKPSAPTPRRTLHV